MQMPAPSVIRLLEYIHIPYERKSLSRKSILLRDHNTCQYCGRIAPAADLTLDHVVPRSRGGSSGWENLVACCLRCNNVKGDRTPQEMDWELRFLPRPPRGAQWTVRGTERTDPRWEPYLALAA